MTDDQAVKNVTVEYLRVLFKDQPQLLHAVTLGDLEAKDVLNEVQTRAKLFSAPVHQFAVGRTHAGKTSLGNLLYGADVMRSTGYQDCTDSVGMLRLRSELCYFDTPGAGSNEDFENVTRMALGLPQTTRRRRTSFELRDYTGATLEGGEAVGVVVTEISAQSWERDFAEEFPPDVIVYVVAAHELFLRNDLDYLQDMLDRYGDKIVIAINTWENKTSPTDVENIRRMVGSGYAEVFPDGSVQPRFVEFDAVKGTNIHELTRLICEVVTPEKLGEMRAVLAGDLKGHALEERSRHYRRTINRIAARLALHTVDQKAGDDDLISVAAKGISQYGVLTFEADEAAQAFRDELNDHLRERVRQVQQERSEVIVTKEVETETREITKEVPQYEEVETTTMEMQKIREELTTAIGKGLWESSQIRAKSLLARGKQWWAGGGKSERDQMRAQMQKDLVTQTTTMVEKEIEVPVTRIEQKIVDYVKEVIATVTEVVGVKESVIGTRALTGGLSVVEFLLSVGLGVEAYCQTGGERGSVESHIIDLRQEVSLKLDRYRPEFEALFGRGASSEAEIAGLLDGLFAS